MNAVPLHRTPLCDWHAAHGGRMVDFAGWNMPVQYRGIVDEHTTVRNVAGLFDISHMGRLWFDGPDACRFLDHLLTNDVSKLKVGQIRYSLVTNEQGGILDDVLVYRWPDRYALVVNASNREKIVDWIDRRRPGFDAVCEDRTFDTTMIALQGPRALEWMQPHVSVELAAMKYYTGLPDATRRETYVSRTGYTGEDGCELIGPAGEIVPLWEQLLNEHGAEGLRACGLGCRDTLRLEAAMPLYGHELSESIDPFTAGLDFAVKLEKPDFVGRAALTAVRERNDLRRRVGIEIAGKRIAREGTPLFAGDREIGVVTSGTQSPTLDKSIAMAYVDAAFAEPGTRIEADFRGKRLPAAVVPLPFYRRR